MCLCLIKRKNRRSNIFFALVLVVVVATKGEGIHSTKIKWAI